MEVSLGAIPFDLDFHPSSPIVASGLINGDLHLYRYSVGSRPERVFEINAHGEESCRAVRFADSGKKTTVASGDDEGCIKVWIPDSMLVATPLMPMKIMSLT
ncbi:WD repeat-containing protein 55 [Carex littledalei]|uniref:WD repeat-containing protein 55 n=1 Tax=Carex littledalei TaxID=544730 RepID=A0A833R1G5_9POAL|nr:WD repeat-containing protein 55 [Carex littledalei]